MKIKSIRNIKLNKPVAVYDISISENDNFVLENGVVVHNSKDVSDCVAGVVFHCVEWMRNPKRQPPPPPSSGFMEGDPIPSDKEKEDLGEDDWIND